MKTIIKTSMTLLVSILIQLQPAAAMIPKNITDHFPSTRIATTGITIKAPAIAENGAVVNISIDSIHIKNNAHVIELWLFDHFRTTPIAHYTLGKNTLVEGLSSRYKLVGSSVIYAIARLSDGRLISGHKAIKITIGGCGNGGSTTTGQHYSAPSYFPYTAPVTTQNRERYASIASNGIIEVRQQPVSTFSIDVDTGSYSNIRRFLLKEGRLPVHDAVRVEEMINYFTYHYPQPTHIDTPFSIHTEVGPNPWNPDTHLLKIGVQAYQEDRTTLPPANLVFLIDVSGSMRSHDKLGLIKASLRMLSRQLNEHDRIAIVVYAGASGVVLDTTAGNDSQRIMNALNQLSAGGSTNGGAGIRLAYAMAKKSFIDKGINRIILATDGDVNVGTVNHQALIDLIKQQRESGITLTTLGFGTGNYNEKLMEQLADHGNGNYAYIDTLREARKVLVTQLASTLFTIARDVKIQVEFNPANVAEYRLIGYENRLLRKQDFKNDKIDAGDIGVGHSVTALYEIALVSSQGQANHPLRYAQATTHNHDSKEIAYVRLRYKGPQGGKSKELKQAINQQDVHDNINNTSQDYRFTAAVAAFGQLLRNSPHIHTMNYNQVYQLGKQSLGHDEKGYRKEFLDLVDAAGSVQ